MNRKHLLICFILLCLSIGLSGCWDARELNSLIIVLGLGIDPDNDNYEVTIQSPVTESASNQSGQMGSQSKFQVTSAIGRTIFEAARNLTTILSRRNYWPHTSTVVLNNQLSSYGMQHAIDFFVRDAQRRRQTYFVLTDQTAKKILSTKPPVESFTSIAIEQLIENSKSTGYGVDVNLNDVVNQIQNLSGTALLNLITLQKSNELASESEIIKLSGTGVIYQYQIVGYLNPIETRAVNIVQNNFSIGTFVLDLEGDSPHDITLEITKIATKLVPEKVNDLYSVNATLFIKCNIVEYTGHENMMNLSLDEVESRMAASLEKEIQKVFERAQKEIKADIFRFGNQFRKIAPELRTISQEEWRQIFLTSVQLDVKAFIEINSAGIVLNRLQ